MILAAGRGNRLRPLTDDLPKPLLAVGGAPLIVHHLRRLHAAGIHDIVINSGWKGARLRQALGDGSAFDVRIQWSVEGWPALDTGGGVAQALPLLGKAPFLLVNGDVWSDADYADLAGQTLDTRRSDAWIWLVPNPPQHPAGDFALAGDSVANVGVDMYTYSGMALLHAGLLAGQAGGAFPLAPLLRAAAGAGRLGGAMLPGDWCDVGTPERLRDMDAKLCARNAVP